MNRGVIAWGSRPRGNGETTGADDPAWHQHDREDETKRIRRVLYWVLIVALVGMVYGASGGVMWSAYHLGRYGAAGAPPLITVDLLTSKPPLPSGSAKHIGTDREDKQQVGATVSARADRSTKRVDAAPSKPRMAIELAAAHRLSARAAPAAPQETLQPLVVRIAPAPSRDLPRPWMAPEARAEVNATSSIDAVHTPPIPSFKPVRAAAIELSMIKLATLRAPRPAFKPNQEVSIVATATRRDPVSSPLNSVRNFFGGIVSAIERGQRADDRGRFVVGRDEDRSDRGSASNEATGSGGGVSGGDDRNDRDNGGSGGVGGGGDRNDRGNDGSGGVSGGSDQNDRSDGGNRGGGGGSGNGRGGGDADDDNDDDDDGDD